MPFLAASETFHHGIPRWDFGLDNPNKAAVLLAFLLIIFLATVLRTHKRWIAWTGTVLAAATGYALAHTFSRGGFIAMLIGASIIILPELLRRPNRIHRWLPLALAAAAIALSAALTGFAGRLANSAPSADASVGNRLVIWRAVPDMMADAPGGWGRGNSGAAFMGWYQPLSRRERYRSLVNSHLTWLVESGTGGRWLLASGWLFALGLGVLRMKRRGDPLPLAIWTCLATAASFSSVAEEWYVWIVPAATLVPASITFCADSTAKARIALVSLSACGGFLLLGATAAWSHLRPNRALAIHRSTDGTRIIIGEREPEGWIVFDGATMGGHTYGRALRSFAQSPEGANRSFGIAYGLAAVPPSAKRLAICGKTADAALADISRLPPSLKELRILSPSKPLDWLAARTNHPANASAAIHVICGELSPNCPAEDLSGLTTVPGAGDYIPSWPHFAFSLPPHKGLQSWP